MPNAHACLDFSCRNNRSRHPHFPIRIPIGISQSFLKNSVRIPQTSALFCLTKKSLELSADKMSSNSNMQLAAHSLK